MAAAFIGAFSSEGFAVNITLSVEVGRERGVRGKYSYGLRRITGGCQMKNWEPERHEGREEKWRRGGGQGGLEPPRGREGGGKISFALVTTDHKNTEGRKEEKKKREGGED
ncbi:hypothetical protein CgunFtcFv8_005259 [Champsocephalus gunnari]|uniref:Uncharacterized protein n=1 Tax=Champsocephalus gunnari TaxID=52237 RepID=A0AAN8HD97_CHAGU|nr:hypothetical protein CgunFtcFv8_005259 [Champsocephalus gunnari]